MNVSTDIKAGPRSSAGLIRSCCNNLIEPRPGPCAGGFRARLLPGRVALPNVPSDHPVKVIDSATPV